jgi:hypothetical protein
MHYPTELRKGECLLHVRALAADLIEQQDKRIAELEEKLHDLCAEVEDGEFVDMCDREAYDWLRPYRAVLAKVDEEVGGKRWNPLNTNQNT